MHALFSRWIVACFLLMGCAAQTEVIEPLTLVSTNVGSRIYRVYLPPGYSSANEARYPVLYLHDGQNVFSTAGPGVAFGWGPWQLDVTADRMIQAGTLKPFIMVAIDNSPKRFLEYRGPANTNSVNASTNQSARAAAMKPGDNSTFHAYSKFLIHELKPLIDRTYRTQSGPAHTAVMGSSLGGIVSLVLAWEHPGVFGQAASLSGAYQVEGKQMIKILKEYQGSPKPFRLYLDSGSRSGGGDDGKANTTAVLAEVERIGWKRGQNLDYYLEESFVTRAEFDADRLPENKFKETQTSHHNEYYWRKRADRPLRFLFGK